MVSDRAFIFHIHIPWDKALSLVPKSRSSVKVKVKYQGYSFSKKWPLQGHWCFTNIGVSQTHHVYLLENIDVLSNPGHHCHLCCHLHCAKTF